MGEWVENRAACLRSKGCRSNPEKPKIAEIGKCRSEASGYHGGRGHQSAMVGQHSGGPSGPREGRARGSFPVPVSKKRISEQPAGGEIVEATGNVS